MNPAEIEEILSGRTNTARAIGLRLLLSMAEPVYTLGVCTIRLLYNLQVFNIHNVSRPVISIGNITTGGTGKTPFTALVVQMLQEAGHRPGIASRGYKSLPGAKPSEQLQPLEEATDGLVTDEEVMDVDYDDEELDEIAGRSASVSSVAMTQSSAGSANDEKQMLEQICPGVPHRQDRDRVRVAQELIRHDRCDRILLDDGFQHRRLHRDLDIVLIDAVNPFGYGHLLPRGLLREPLTSLQRADLIVITRVDLISAEELQQIREALSYFTRAGILEVCFEPTCWRDTEGRQTPLESSSSMTAPIAFCGIGNPAGFRQLLHSKGIEIAETDWIVYPDHHHYSDADLAELIQKARPADGLNRVLLTTQKDLVKLTGRIPADVSCQALCIEAVVRSGQEKLEQALVQLG